MAMLGKKSKPVIGILTGSLVSGSNRSSTVSVAATARKNHVESSTQSTLPPKGQRKNFDLGGVGLGIVAALEKSSENAANTVLFSRISTRSHPIPVKNCPKNRTKCYENEMEMDSLEEYTIVTCHGPKNSYTKVYNSRKCDDRSTTFRIQNSITNSYNNNKKTSVFHISPVKSGEVPTVPPSDFLNSCDLCGKKLHDKDIYMYRGEKAFCSTECRYRQIVTDERKEKCSASSEASIRGPVDVNYAKDQIFTSGILAI